MKKAEETIGKEIYWQLPNDYRTMIQVRNNGVPLTEQAPKAAITQSIVAMAESLSSDEKRGGAEPATRKSGIGRLLHLWPNK